MQINLTLSPKTVLKRIAVPLALLGLCLALVMTVNLLATRPSSTAQQGVLSLMTWNPERDNKIALPGEWVLFWDAFLTPEDVQKRFDDHGQYVYFPGRWNGAEYQGKILPAQGKATVALRLKLPESHRHYTLKIPSLTLDYRLWIDGKLVIRNQQMDDPVQTARAFSKLRLVDFVAQGDTTELVFQVANYRSKTGGIWESLLIAPSEYKSVLDTFSVTRDVVTSFLLCLASVMLIFLAYRHQRLAYVFLSLWAASMAIRAGTIEERLLFQFFEIHDFEIQRKLEYGILYLTVPFFALYLGYRFPRYFRKELHLITVAMMSALILLVMISPATVYGQSVQIFQSFVIIYAFLWFGALVEYVSEQPLAGGFILVGSIIFVSTAVNDILFTNHLISGLNLSQMGALVFLCFGYFLYLFEQTQPEDAPENAATTELEEPQQETEPQLTRQEEIASVMQYALAQWESIGKDKITLAEESGLWRITNDDGTLKTRTLDKYLRADAMPNNPRTKAVIGTLCFVAQQDGLGDDVKEQLQQMARQLS